MPLKAYNVRLFLNDGSAQGVFYVEAHTPNLAKDKARMLCARQHGGIAGEYRLASISRGIAVTDCSTQRIEQMEKELF